MECFKRVLQLEENNSLAKKSIKEIKIARSKTVAKAEKGDFINGQFNAVMNKRLQNLRGFRGGMILLLRIILDIFLGLTGHAPLSSRHYFKY